MAKTEQAFKAAVLEEQRSKYLFAMPAGHAAWVAMLWSEEGLSGVQMLVSLMCTSISRKPALWNLQPLKIRKSSMIIATSESPSTEMLKHFARRRSSRTKRIHHRCSPSTIMKMSSLKRTYNNTPCAFWMCSETAQSRSHKQYKHKSLISPEHLRPIPEPRTTRKS